MIAACTAALLLTPSLLWAQPATDPIITTLTEAEFVAAVEEEHPAFRAAQEALGLALAERTRAATLDDPVLSLGREDPSGPGSESEATLSWQPFEAGRRASVLAAERRVSAAWEQVSLTTLELHLEVRRAFAEWAVDAAERSELAAQAERFAALAERERRRTEAGESSGLDARRLELAAAEARARSALAEAAAVRSRAVAAGWYPDLSADARAALPPLPSLPAAAGYTDDPHPRLAALEAELAAVEQEAVAASRFVAFPELTLGWKREEDGAGSADGPVFGLGWRLPLFDRNRAERAVASVRRDAAAARLAAANREIEAERTGARAAYARLAEAAGEARRAAEEAGPAVAAVEAAFRAGEAATTDLLDTLRAVTGARLTALELHAHALAAHRDWERAAGGSSGETP